MDAAFWHQKWENNQTAFHRTAVNALLTDHLAYLALEAGDTVFIPLCGKTLDIDWLLTQGFKVKGIELYEPAVEALFAALALTPEVTELKDLKCYRADDITIYVGDIFRLTKSILGVVDAVYDRAAIVALPDTMRQDYTKQVLAITEQASQLLINYVYDQSKLMGPPFSVSNDELKSHYGDTYQMTLLFSADVAGGMKGQCPATEHVWLLKQD
ncbi:UNVERIFIED_CONTAM: hypothetical protein GTU68_010752 [Idotea baltica]|nr:hypothetical protein [Idotea baltica]